MILLLRLSSYRRTALGFSKNLTFNIKHRKKRLEASQKQRHIEMLPMQLDIEDLHDNEKYFYFSVPLMKH